MTREEKIHWLENAVFENGGVIDIEKKMPIIYHDRKSAISKTKSDIPKKLEFLMGDPLMISLEMSDTSVPIYALTDGSINSSFNEFCL
jgi:hypothetical protein